ncbi:hypothetical protein ABZ614_15965 [Streptomyces sp. NPDC013178]|uniref:hypothetical protein n=1 Tax=Streptomyces sp. NPDC013178 TaxID=3155118 RepID=UPI0033C3D5A0
MNQHPEQGLHQVVFRWEGNRGRSGTGITAVAYSCEEEYAEELRAELAPLLQAQGTEQPSQVRYVRPHNGEVVVINRRRGPDAHGRPSTESHALVGDRDVLKARMCLTLGHLPPPLPSGGSSEADSGGLRPARLDDLKNAADRGWQQFTTQVPTVREPLTAVAAQLLRTPDHLMSVRIPEFSSEGTNDTPLLIWGLCGIFGNWLGRDFWTYATYDTSDSHGLRVVGVPSWRTSAIEDVRLERIALGSAPNDEAQQIAGELVRRFLSEPNNAAGVRLVLDQCPTGAKLPMHDRVRTLARLLERHRPAAAAWTGAADVRPVNTAHPAGDEARPLPAAGQPEATDAAGTWGGDPAAHRFHEQPHLLLPDPSVLPGAHPPPSAPAPTAQARTDSESAVRGGAHQQHLDQHLDQHPARESTLSWEVTATGSSGKAAPDPEVSAHATPAAEAGTSADPHLRQPRSTWPPEPQRPPSPPQHVHGLLPGEPPPDGDGRFEDPSPRLPLAPLRPLPQPRTRGLARAVTFARRGHDRGAREGDDAEMPDEVLLARLRNKDLPRREVDRLLDALADGTRYRTLRQAHHLCRGVLKQRLYLWHGRRTGRGDRDGHDVRRAAETAFWLLHWAVLPYVGHPQLSRILVRLFHDACAQDRPVERHFLNLVAFVRVYGVPNLPSEAWWELVHYVRRGSAGPLPETLRAFHGRGADRHPVGADAERAVPSDDRWRFFFLAMTCVAALLLLLLILVAWW